MIQTPAQYVRVRLVDVPKEFEDEVVAHCFEHLASGVSEALQFRQPDLTYDPNIVFNHKLQLDVFFDSTPKEIFFSGLQKWITQWSIHQEDHKDWLEEWKKDFKAFCLAGPFWVVPSWEPLEDHHEKPLRIDPGMAFGTGTHATTKMMASLLFKISQSSWMQQQASAQKTVSLLDVGTGTGILALMASYLGFKEVVGIEIDPIARRVAEDNILLNQRLDINISNLQLEELHSIYDVVIANIIDGVLLKLKKDLLRVCRPGGYLLLTGILQERDELFFEKFIAQENLQVIRRLEKEEWVGYWVQRL